VKITRNKLKILIGKSESTMPLRTRHGWKGNAKVDLEKLGYEEA
jgi:hypothetical protein